MNSDIINSNSPSEGLTLSEIIAANLKELLRVNRVTQKELADKMGLAPATMSEYCKGRRIPGAEFFVLLKNLYGISIDDFLTKTEVVSPSVSRDSSAAIDSAMAATYRKYSGLYFLYYLDTSKYKGRDFLSARESLQYGLLYLYELPSSIDLPSFASAAILGIDSREKAESIYTELEKQTSSRLVLDYMNKHAQNTAYYGSFELSQNHAYVNIRHDTTDRALLIFYHVESNKKEFIGGLGTINSVSKGREHMPVAQFMGISRYPLIMSEEEIQHALLLHYPNFKAEAEAAEMTDVFKTIYSQKNNITEYHKSVMVRSTLERAIKNTLERNMFRCAKISARDDDEWYHLIKNSTAKDIGERR